MYFTLELSVLHLEQKTHFIIKWYLQFENDAVDVKIAAINVLQLLKRVVTKQSTMKLLRKTALYN